MGGCEAEGAVTSAGAASGGETGETAADDSTADGHADPHPRHGPPVRSRAGTGSGERSARLYGGAAVRSAAAGVGGRVRRRPDDSTADEHTRARVHRMIRR